MECPYCGEELDDEGPFGRLAGHQDGKVLGDIYSCPIGREGIDCGSMLFNVSGSFYAYREGDTSLQEGYPC